MYSTVFFFFIFTLNNTQTCTHIILIFLVDRQHLQHVMSPKLSTRKTPAHKLLSRKSLPKKKENRLRVKVYVIHILKNA